MDRVDAMMNRRVGCALVVAALGTVGCSTSGANGGATSGGTESAAPLPMLASYDASCALDSDCAVVAEPACAPCRKAALSTKDAPRYSAALGEAQKTETCQRQIARSGPCSIEGAVIARCSGAVCGLVAAPPPDAGAPADASLD